MTKITLIMLFTCLSITGCKKQSDSKTFTEADISYRYAVVSQGQYVSLRDPYVVSIDNKLNELSQLTGLSKDKIGNTAFAGVDLLRKKGVSAKGEDMLDALIILLKASPSLNKMDNSKLLSTMIAYYANARLSLKFNHQQAVQSLLGIISAAKKAEHVK